MSQDSSEYKPLSKALKRLNNPSPASIWRWTRKGVRGVKLQAWLIGGRWYTTDAAVDAFVEATTAAANAPSIAPQSAERSPVLARQLAAAGVL